MNHHQSLSTHRLLILTVAVLALAGLAHLLLLADLPFLAAQAVGGLLLAVILPGVLLTDVLLGPARTARHWLMLALSGMGAGCGIAILVMLLLSYLPGGVTRNQALLLFDAILFFLLAAEWLTRRRTNVLAPDEDDGDPRWLWLGVAALLLLAGTLRLIDLGYSEFQGDEARVMLRASEMLTGYENALMVHQKGPGEILLPGALYALMGRINESAARLPFALANMAGVVAGLLLGRLLFCAFSVLISALFLLFNGYLIAFGRIVQYQSVIFLLTVLVVLLLYEAVRMKQASARRLTLVAFLAATGLLAHYEMAGVAVPALFLLWHLWRRSVSLKKLALALAAPLVVGLVVAGAFYLPYFLHPAFTAAYAYVFGYRMGGGSFPHNNLLDFFQRSSLYSSSYYLLALILITFGYLLAIYRRHLPRAIVAVIGAGLAAGLAYTFSTPSWLRLADNDHIWLLFGLPIVAVWLLPRVSLEERLVFLWFGALMIFSLFVVARPNSHVYTFFIPWALLAGGGAQLVYGFIKGRWGATPANALAGATVVFLALLFGNYVYRLFVYNQVEVLRTW
jgi:4-amino-4-deoxy-L-arabinose transferase-like glycosyltransferase